MSPVKKLRCWGDTTGGRTQLRVNINKGLEMRDALEPSSERYTDDEIMSGTETLESDAEGSLKGIERLEGRVRVDDGAAALTMVTGCMTLFKEPHSYFFFWAFSAALVILPVVTSLNVTLLITPTATV